MIENLDQVSNKGKKIKVLVIPSDRSGVSKFRSIDPHLFLQSEYPIDFHVDINYEPPMDDMNFWKDYEIVAFHRSIGHDFERAKNLILTLNKMGIITICDIDDYWMPTKDHPIHEIIKIHKINEKIIENLKAASYVTTTTRIYADLIRKYNKNVFVFPNAINPKEAQFNEPTLESDRVRVGWLGGSCYDDTTEILTENGFKLFKDLDKNEKVATLNPTTNEIEYHIPIHHIAEPYKGDLNCVKTNLIEYAVTPNHKMYVSPIKNLMKKRLNFGLIESKDVYGTNFHVMINGILTGNDEKYFTFELVKENDHYKKPYDGIVYCVEVQNHILYVRKNGKAFWCGNSHQNDLLLLDKSFGSLKKYSDKLQFVLCGFDTRGSVTEINAETKEQKKRNIKPEETVWARYEEIFTQKYSTLSYDYKKYLLKFVQEPYDKENEEAYVRAWTKPVTSYAKNYAKFDISLAPIKNHIFNEMKSQLKVIEAGFYKKALVASNFGPYTIDLKHGLNKGTFVSGGNALLVDVDRNGVDWAKYIEKLMKNPNLVKDLGENLYETVKDTYSLITVTKNRAEFYKSLIK